MLINTGSIGTLFTILLISAVCIYSQPLIIDHTSVNIQLIPSQAIENAKSKLHIAYGHTSHGSQLTTGMTGLVSFANGGGKGMKHAQNIFSWNNGGKSGALDLIDGGVLAGDVGYYPDWVTYTRNLLNNPLYSRVNVIMWSWCGQVSAKYSAGKLFSEYINPMEQLEKDYPNVKFVYMTGHVDHDADAANKAANSVIRNFCRNNTKILFDFADIESYNPDGKFFEFVSDACDYFNASGTKLGNWAVEWQNSKKVGVDWYDCSSAHSQPLNANLKAYAAWWLFARLAGWSGLTAIEKGPILSVKFELSQNYPNPFNPTTVISYQLSAFSHVSLKVFDVLGREVATLVDELKQTGKYSTLFTLRSTLSSGVYFYQLKASNPSAGSGQGFIQTKKMLFAK